MENIETVMLRAVAVRYECFSTVLGGILVVMTVKAMPPEVLRIPIHIAIIGNSTTITRLFRPGQVFGNVFLENSVRAMLASIIDLNYDNRVVQGFNPDDPLLKVNDDPRDIINSPDWRLLSAECSMRPR